MLSVGTLIWVSLRPLIRLVLTVGCGFAITKADIFPQVAARGAGQIMLNIALPCLMFSKIVPAFNAGNISALGPLVLVAVIYQAIGIIVGWVIKQFFWVPHRFRYGLLVAGGWGNYGDIPTSVVMSITGSAPFNGVQDQNIAVAYMSAFILVFFVTLFPLGGHRWVAMDYVGPDMEDDEVREAMRLKRLAFFKAWTRPTTYLRRRRPSSIEAKDLEDFSTLDDEKNEPVLHEDPCNSPSVIHDAASAPITQHSGGKHVSFYHDDATTAVPTEALRSQMCSPAPTIEYAHSRVTSPAPTVTHVDSVHPLFPAQSAPQSAPYIHTPDRYLALFASVRKFLRSLLNPASCTIITAFVIAIVPDLQALFIPSVSGTHIPPAPDGQPPLAFIMDTSSFVGAASVPLSLICLGSALARLKVPRNQWSSLPLGAISWLAVAKVLVTPVLGVLICQGLVSVGVIDQEDKVLRFVCIFFSCLPTATTQVFLTQVYSGTGSAEHLSAFLIPQYIIMFVSMTALTAYSLQLLF